MEELTNFPATDPALAQYLFWALEHGGKFHAQLIEYLCRYPVSAREFIEGEQYLGLKSVYPAVVEALEQIYNAIGVHLPELVFSKCIAFAGGTFKPAQSSRWITRQAEATVAIIKTQLQGRITVTGVR